MPGLSFCSGVFPSANTHSRTSTTYKLPGFAACYTHTFVAAGTEHQFEDITEDLALWRVFYGPHGGEVPA